jgi:hypothetical protein
MNDKPDELIFYQHLVLSAFGRLGARIVNIASREDVLYVFSFPVPASKSICHQAMIEKMKYSILFCFYIIKRAAISTPSLSRVACFLCAIRCYGKTPFSMYDVLVPVEE